MASGDTLLIWSAPSNEPPATSMATFDTRNAEPVLDFDADADEAAVFPGIMPRNYAGGGVTINLHWEPTSDVNNAHFCRWGTQLEALVAQDMDADGFATANTAGGNPSTTSGIMTVTSIAHTSGAQMDGILAGEAFRLKVYRDADGTSGTDDVTGDAELRLVELKET